MILSYYIAQLVGEVIKSGLDSGLGKLCVVFQCHDAVYIVDFIIVDLIGLIAGLLEHACRSTGRGIAALCITARLYTQAT